MESVVAVFGPGGPVAVFLLQAFEPSKRSRTFVQWCTQRRYVCACAPCLVSEAFRQEMVGSPLRRTPTLPCASHVTWCLSIVASELVAPGDRSGFDWPAGGNTPWQTRIRAATQRCTSKLRDILVLPGRFRSAVGYVVGCSSQLLRAINGGVCWGCCLRVGHAPGIRSGFG